MSGPLILGRSPNLILGALTAVFNVFVIANLPYVWDPAVVAAVNIAAAAVITLIAGSDSVQVAAGRAAAARKA